MTVAINDTIKSSPWSETTRFRASAAIAGATTTNTASFPGVDRYSGAIVQFRVTAATGTTPTINCYIQTLLPDQVTWCDIISFSQATGASHQVAGIVNSGNSVFAVTTGSLAVGTANVMPMGQTWRASFITAGTNPSFTCEVTVTFIE